MDMRLMKSRLILTEEYNGHEIDEVQAVLTEEYNGHEIDEVQHSTY